MPGGEETSRQPFSHSRLSTFESCPLQYRFRYVDRIPRAEVSVEAFLGTCVHLALEHLYAKVRDGRVPPLEELLSVFACSWTEGFGPQVRIRRSRRSEEDYRMRGEGWLARYFRDHHPFNEDLTLGLEEQVEVDLAEGDDYWLIGFIDRLARAPDGTLEIHDYKTSASLPTSGRLLADRQLPLYQIAVQKQRPEENKVRLVWHYLAHARRLEICCTPRHLESVRAGAVGVIDRIRAEKDFSPRESPLCDWCDYQSLCPVGQRRIEGGGPASFGS